MITPATDDSGQRFSPIYLVIFAVLLWSTGGLFIKMTSLDAFSINLGRSLLAAIVVAIFTFKNGLRLDSFTLLTSFLYAGTLSAFVYANKNTTAANAIFLQYTGPIYVLILSPFVLKEKFRLQDLATVLICMAGMSMFFLEQATPSSNLATDVFSGNIVALISGLFFGLYLLFLRHPRALSNSNPAISVFYGNILVVLVMLPFVLNSPPKQFGSLDILAVFLLGVFQIGVAYILFTKGIARGIRSVDAGIIGFMEPMLNPIWVFIFLRERPSTYAMLGGAIILIAVAFHTLKKNRTKLEK